MVSRLVTISALLVGGMFAQRADTVYYQVAANTSNNALTIPIPQANNIGQPYHIVYVDFFDAPTHTCTTPIPTSAFVPPVVDISGGDGLSSSPITNYTRIVQPNSSGVGNRYRMLSSAAGAYPFLSVQVSGWDNVNCRANVFYSGSLSSIDIKKYADFGSVTDPLSTFTQTVAAADTTLITQVCASCRITVYSLVVYNQTLQTVQLLDDRKDASTTNLMLLGNWCAACQIALPNTNFPLFTTSTGGSIRLHTGSGTSVSVTLSYRVE